MPVEWNEYVFDHALLRFRVRQLARAQREAQARQQEDAERIRQLRDWVIDDITPRQYETYADYYDGYTTTRPSYIELNTIHIQVNRHFDKIKLTKEEEPMLSDEITVELSEAIIATLINNIKESKQTLIKDLEAHTEQMARHEKIKSSSGTPLEKVRDCENIISYWKVRIAEREKLLKGFEALIKKLDIDKRPVKLTQNEKKLVASIVDKLSLDYGILAKDSTVKHINHPDRFYMFPRLEKSARKRINEVNEQLRNLTRSDVNVYLR